MTWPPIGVLEGSGRVALAAALLGAAAGRGGPSWEAVARPAEGGEVFAGHPYADIFKPLEVATASVGAIELDRHQALGASGRRDHPRAMLM